MTDVLQNKNEAFAEAVVARAATVWLPVAAAGVAAGADHAPQPSPAAVKASVLVQVGGLVRAEDSDEAQPVSVAVKGVRPGKAAADVAEAARRAADVAVAGEALDGVDPVAEVGAAAIRSPPQRWNRPKSIATFWTPMMRRFPSTNR